MDNEYLINIKVKNNLLLSAINATGAKNLTEFCNIHAIPYQQVLALITMRDSPLDSKMRFRVIVGTLCEILNKLPSELFTEKQLYISGGLSKNIEMPEAKIEAFLLESRRQKTYCLEEQIIKEDEQKHLKDSLRDVLDKLTPREAKILRMRFGIDMNADHTLEEVSKQFDVSRERIRGIEAKALNKLRHPTRSEKLQSFLDEL